MTFVRARALLSIEKISFSLSSSSLKALYYYRFQDMSSTREGMMIKRLTQKIISRNHKLTYGRIDEPQKECAAYCL